MPGARAAIRLCLAVVLMLPVDWLPASASPGDGRSPAAALADPPYSVIPILFVPQDVAPHPLGLPFVDKQMQLVQRWYAEQLRGRTFRLQPARLVMGAHTLGYYYGEDKGCYPRHSGCDPTYNYVWLRTMADLAEAGYPGRSDQVIGVFFQHEGAGYFGFGTTSPYPQFFVSLEPDAILGDCLAKGCLLSNRTGVAAHELGHGFGLLHPASDPENSFGWSVMGIGFYGFPGCTLMNTSTNHERDFLNASPFFNVTWPLADGGFEDCLQAWDVAAGATACNFNAYRSGLYGLSLLPGAEAVTVAQTVTVQAGQAYDFSGWLRLTGQASFRAEVRALDDGGAALAVFPAGSDVTLSTEWGRFGLSMVMPAGTIQAEIRLSAGPGSGVADVDDVVLTPAASAPPAPLPLFHSDGDVVPTLPPTLRWADTPAATSFQLQIAGDLTFAQLITETATASPFYTVTQTLETHRRYFWRVRGVNSAGPGPWSPVWSFIPAEPADAFNDEFETGALNPAWLWLRPDPDDWGFGGLAGFRSSGFLWITTGPGDLATARNLLLRPAPAGDFEASTVTFPTSTAYRQSGVVVYQDAANYLSVTQVYTNGYKVEFRAVVGGQRVAQACAPTMTTLPVKLARQGDDYRAYYSTDFLTWRPLGEPVRAVWPQARMGVAAFDPLGSSPAPAYFDWFRVRPGCVRLHLEVRPPEAGDIIESAGDCEAGLGHSAGFTVTVSAESHPGYRFSHWTGAITGSTNPAQITLSTGASVTAVFAPESRVYLPIIRR